MNDDFDVRELSGFSLVHVATRGNSAAAAGALSTALGVTVSAAANSVAATTDGLAVLWFGAGRWLLRAPQADWSPGAIDGCVATDLSDSRRLFRLAGAGAGNYLSQSCPLDLDPAAMPPGSCAMTQFDRFTVLLHRRELQVFDLYVERSYALALPGGVADALRS